MLSLLNVITEIKKYKSTNPNTIRKGDLKLFPFNRNYWNILPNDKSKLIMDPRRGIYHTICGKGLNLGIVGIFINPMRKSDSFFQVYIDPDFRGRGLITPISFLVAKKYGINKIINIVNTSEK